MYDRGVAQNIRFVFLADANVETGAGHVRRCLTIAQELKNKKIETKMETNTEVANKGELKKKKKERGYTNHELICRISSIHLQNNLNLITICKMLMRNKKGHHH